MRTIQLSASDPTPDPHNGSDAAAGRAMWTVGGVLIRGIQQRGMAWHGRSVIVDAEIAVSQYAGETRPCANALYAVGHANDGEPGTSHLQQSGHLPGAGAKTMSWGLCAWLLAVRPEPSLDQVVDRLVADVDRDGAGRDTQGRHVGVDLSPAGGAR